MSRSACGGASKGEIEFLLGKPELVAKGHFDDIDMAMMIHLGSHDQMRKRSYIAEFVERRAGQADPLFRPRQPRRRRAAARHQRAVGGADRAQRDPLPARELLRQGHDPHPPDHHQGRRRGQRRAGRGARWRPLCAAARCEAIIDANMKVDRCLRAGAMAMGAEVEINTIPGYLPQRNNRAMGECVRRQCRGDVRAGLVRHRRPPHRLDRHGRHRAHDAGDPSLRRRARAARRTAPISASPSPSTPI